jgi:hypothetical protein
MQRIAASKHGMDVPDRLRLRKSIQSASLNPQMPGNTGLPTARSVAYALNSRRLSGRPRSGRGADVPILMEMSA